MFRAVGFLQGHKEDVKAIRSFPTSNSSAEKPTHSIASVSRDGTLRIWDPLPALEQDQMFNCRTLYSGKEFLNSVCVLENDKTIFVGGNSGKIYEIDTVLSKPVRQITGHVSNVCALEQSADNKRLYSGSWDSTARVWDISHINRDYDSSREIELQILATLTNENAVWAIAPISGNINAKGSGAVITGSADASIRVWVNGKMDVEVKKAHSGPVRGLAILETSNTDGHTQVKFASCGNDGLIIIWEYSSKLKECRSVGTLSGHTSFVYSITTITNGSHCYLVSGSEDRTVRVWDWNKCQIVETIVLPMISVWCVAAYEDGFVCGGSDSCLWVFRPRSVNQSLEASPTAAENALNTQLLNFTIDKRELENSGVSSVPISQSVLSSAGSDGQLVVISDDSIPNAPPAQVVYYYNSSKGEWERVGVLSEDDAQATGPSKQYNSEDGNMYDYVFEIDADGKMLKLPYNLGDNPFIVATKFQEKYELPQAYVDQIAEFINKNTQGAAKASQSQKNPTFSSSGDAALSSASHNQTYQVLPFTDYVKLTAVNPQGLVNALKKENEQVPRNCQLSPNEVKLIEQYLQEQSPEESNNRALGGIVTRVHETWPAQNRLPIADVMRLIALTTSNPAQYLQPIFSNLSPEHPKLALVAIRAAVNLFNNPKGLPLITNEDIAKEVLGYIDSMANQLPTDKMTQVALASLALNYASSPIVENRLELAATVLRIIAAIGPHTTDSEATYRFQLALGTTLFKNSGDESIVLAQSLGLDSWIQKAPSEEQRFAPLRQDIAKVLRAK